MKDFCEVKRRLYRGIDITILADNLGIHHDADVAQIALRDGIRLVFLPPNTSHFTQPLDQVIFAIFKTILDKSAQDIAQESNITGEKMTSSEIMSMATALAAAAAFKEDAIREAFKTSFIWPWDPSGFLDAAQRNVGQSTRRVVERVQSPSGQVRLEARRASSQYLQQARKSFAERKKGFVSVAPKVDYAKSVSAEQLIQLKDAERAKRQADAALKDAVREEKAAKKREREKITCKAPGCKTYENSPKDKKRNPFRWCDYCDEFGICGVHFEGEEFAALISEHEASCPMRPPRGRKAARKQ